MTISASDVKKIEERWSTIRTEVIESWPQLTQADLEMIDGDSQKLIALVHQKTGAAMSEIEDVIDTIAAGSDGLMSRVSRSITHAASAVTDRVNGAAIHTCENFGETVKGHPGRSLVIVLGAGLVLGLSLSSLFKSSRPKRWYSDYQSDWLRRD